MEGGLVSISRIARRASASSSTSRLIVRAIQDSGTDFICSVPCSLLANVLELISEKPGITKIPVTREEEGVGICAGAFLGGARPALMMQNSGLGNSINSLLSLTRFYEIPLFLIIGYRGRVGEEKVEAQIPMGRATEDLLSLIGAKKKIIDRVEDIDEIRDLGVSAFKRNRICAALLTPKLWGESK